MANGHWPVITGLIESTADLFRSVMAHYLICADSVSVTQAEKIPDDNPLMFVISDRNPGVHRSSWIQVDGGTSRRIVPSCAEKLADLASKRNGH